MPNDIGPRNRVAVRLYKINDDHAVAKFSPYLAHLIVSIGLQRNGGLRRKVADCDLDCAIAFVTDHHTLPSTVSSTVIGVETLVVVAARTFDTPRKNGKSVRIRDLESYGWIVNPSRNFAACLRSNKRIMPLRRRCPGLRSASVVGRERSGAWPRSKPTRRGQSAAAQISYYHSKRFPTGGQSDAAARNGAWKSLAGRQSP